MRAAIPKSEARMNLQILQSFTPVPGNSEASKRSARGDLKYLSIDSLRYGSFFLNWYMKNAVYLPGPSSCSFCRRKMTLQGIFYGTDNIIISHCSHLTVYFFYVD